MGRGRPKGSKNKPKVKPEEIKPAENVEPQKSVETTPQTEGDDDGK